MRGARHAATRDPTRTTSTGSSTPGRPRRGSALATVADAKHARRRDVLTRRVAAPVVVEYLLSHLGMFAVLPVLPQLVGDLVPGTSAVFVGAALLSFSLTLRGGSLVISGLLHRAPVRLSMSGGLLLTGVAFAVLAGTPGPAGVLAALTAAGLGISTNGLAARAYVAMTVSDPAARNSVFSAIQIAVNVSAAVGPVVASFLVSDHRDGLLLLLVAGTYHLAALVVAVAVPRGLRPRDGDMREPLRLGLLAVIVTDPRIRRVSVVTAAGSFLYGQFFSAFAIQAASIDASPGTRAGFFVLNAILVIALQIPVTRHTNRGLDRGVPPLRYLLRGVAAFALSCGIFGLSGSAVVGLLVGVAVFSLAETYFTPLVNTAYSGIARDRPVVEAFNLRQVAVSAGEALGAFCGGTLFLAAVSRGAGSSYWITLSVLGLALVATRLHAERATVDARRPQPGPEGGCS